MDETTQAEYMYVDAFILVTSLCAQYLLAIKKLENWILWILVDSVAIVLYAVKKLYITSGLYFVYLLLCIVGYLQWRSTLEESNINIADKTPAGS